MADKFDDLDKYPTLPLMAPEGHSFDVPRDANAGSGKAGYRPEAVSTDGVVPPKFKAMQEGREGQRMGMGGTPSRVQSVQPAPKRELTPQELSAMADAWMARMAAEHSASMEAGPTVRKAQEEGNAAVPEWLSRYMEK